MKNAAKTDHVREPLDETPDELDASSTRAAAMDARRRDERGRNTITVARTEGQRLLLGVTDPLSKIGAAIGASKQAVSAWRNGVNLPDDYYRAALERRYKIPSNSWGGPKVENDADDEDGDDEDADLASDVELLIRMLRKQIKRTDLSPRERVQLTEAFGRALAQKAKLERDRELLEDRTVREHPKWKRFRDELIDTLLPFPDAARAVEALIIRLLGEEEAETSRDVDE